MRIFQWFVLGCAVGALGAIGGAFLMLIGPLAPAAQALGSLVVPTPQSVHVLFVGDLMFDRNVALHTSKSGEDALFAGVRDLFSQPDLLVGNLEGAITTNASIAQQNHSILAFTFATSTAELLARVGFDAVSLANNHSLDFGKDGYNQTIQFLNRAGVSAFGSPYNTNNIATVIRAHDKNICLVGYHGLFDPDPTSVLSEVAASRWTCDYVVVMAHWGVEYQHLPTAQQRQFAHEFIDAGADVVIGGHPHVVEPLEIYNNHAIFYSLGNFLFDQGFRPEVERGLAVEIDFESSSTQFALTPVTTYEEAGIASGTVAEAVMDDVVTPYLPPDMAEEIKSAGAFELRK